MTHEQLNAGEGLRYLASVRQVSEVLPHPDADRLAIAKIDGWSVVMDIETTPGQLVIFFEPDAIFNGVKIKQRKIRGVVSQGYAIALTKGKDLTKELGVTKQVSLAERVEGFGNASLFSLGVPKTDEERWQNRKNYLEVLHESGGYHICRKYDGSSGTFGYIDGQLVCHSRKQSVTGANSWTEVAVKYNLAEALADTPNLVLQGEVIGPKIQGNPHKVSCKEFRAFDLFDRETGEYLTRDELEAWCQQHSVPIVECISTVELLPEEAANITLLQHFANQEHEGIVVRPLTEMKDYRGNRVSFKVIKDV